MLFNFFLAIIGLIILTIAADKLVEGAAGVAHRIGISPLVVGLTIVAMGTSAPELVVSVQSSFEGNPGIAVGNCIGSNLFNIAAILGIAAIIRPIAVSKPVIRRDVPIMIITAGMAWLYAYDRTFSRFESLFMVLCLTLYVSWGIYEARRNPEAAPVEETKAPETTLSGEIARIVLGLVALVGGSKLLLVGSVGLAKMAGISDEVIGLTLIAAGTSMPELATSVVASFRGQPDIAVGNVVGSNIFNILGILGVAGTLLPLEVSQHMFTIDIPLMVIASIACFPIMRSGWVISRAEGVVLVTGYIIYTFALIMGY